MVASSDFMIWCIYSKYLFLLELSAIGTNELDVFSLLVTLVFPRPAHSYAWSF